MTNASHFQVATPRMASGVLFQDDAGQVLLVKPTYKDGWDLPGGYVEPGESPLQACRREVREELGIDVAPTRLLVVDWAPHPEEGDKVLWIFYGGHLPPDAVNGARLQASEIAEARFWPRDDFDTVMPDRLSRRLQAAVTALDEKVDVYLEHGTRRSS